MRYLKPVNKKVLRLKLTKPQARDIEDVLLDFTTIEQYFSNKQFINLIANIVADRAVDRGTGQFMNDVCKEIESRKDAVLDFIHS